MNNTRIQLIGNVTGYLDLKEGTAFPITISLSDIRDISKRNGSYSKTITLIGNHNNNKLLGNIFDINIVDGSFNINTLQECLVEQDGVVILDNMYIQLTSIKKVQPDASYDYDIEYEVEIKDSSSDFFTKIQNLELTALDLSAFNHVYEVSSITQSFDNTYVDGYKYLLPYNDSTEYIIQDFKPAVYNKIYWDQIFDNAGYTYTFDEQDNLDIRFKELIIPYNGDKPKPIEDQTLWVVSNKTTPVTLRVVESLTYPARVPIILDNEISDPSNFYNPTLGEYTVPFDIGSPDSYVYEFKVNYDFYLYNQQAFDVIAYGNLPNKKYGLKLFCNNNSSYGQLDVPQNLVIPSGTTYSLGTNIEQVITINSSDLLTGDTILNYFNTWTSNNQSQVWTEVNVPQFQRRITNEITINSIEVTIKPSLDTFPQGSFLTMNSFIPKKVKQSDYIKSICQMFNLYLETDKDDITNIIIRTRDEFYDSGEVKNWSDKLAKDSDQNIKFLPELSNKKVILTYKDDKDTLNSNYKNIINETYGQLEYVFENDYIRNVERKEIIFSPTPILYTDFQAVVPSLVGIAPNCNIRILLDNGVKECLDWTINATQSSAVTLDYYPLLSHFAGDPENPVFDINYGTCDFYFYNPDNIEIIKRNNLYFSHWERTLNQINNGKLLTVSFELDAIDILNLKLNDKIFIDNSYWNINKVIDYDPNSNNLTRVELISIDDDLELPDIRVKSVYKPVNGDIELVDKGKLTNGVGKTKWIYTNIDASNGKTEIKGIQNQTSNLTSGYIDGDNNLVNAIGKTYALGDNNIINSNAIVLGNNNTVDENLVEVFVFGDNITVTESRTTYTNNIQTTPGSTINGNPVENLDIWEKTLTVPDTAYSIFNKYAGHIIDTASLYNVIAGGANNTIEVSGIEISRLSSILAGTGNRLSGTAGCAIIAGEDNIIEYVTSPTTTSVIVGGRLNVIQDANDSAIVCGDGNIINNSFASIILCGNNNSSLNGTINLIAGTNHIIDSLGGGNVIIGGSSGLINLDATECLIISGENHTIDGILSIHSVIIGGSSNSISDLENTIILGGSGIVATQDNTVYVPFLNISSVPAGTSINNLGIDAGGNVVIGASGGPTTSTWAQVLVNGNVSGGTNVVISLGDRINSDSNSVTGNSYITLSDNDPDGIYLFSSDGTDSTYVAIEPRVFDISTINFRLLQTPQIAIATANLVFRNDLTGAIEISTLTEGDLSGLASGLPGVLAIDNTTGGTDVEISNTDRIVSEIHTGGGYPGTRGFLTFDYQQNGNGIIMLCAEDGGNDSMSITINPLGGISIGSDNTLPISLGTGGLVEVAGSLGINMFTGTVQPGVSQGYFNITVFDDIETRDNIIYVENNIVNSITTTATDKPAIFIGTNNSTIGAGVVNSVIVGGSNMIASYNDTVYQQDSYRDGGNHTVTTTNNTITDLYTFTPDTNGVWIIEANVTGFENATGDAIGAKVFATFKNIAGVVTQVSTQTLDRKSNFPASVTVAIDTDSTNIRIRVRGRSGSTINWRGSLTITK